MANDAYESGVLLMSEMQAKSVCFVKIHLKNYGILRYSNEMEFNRHQTFISGMNGTGKTIIVKALTHLGMAPEIKPHFDERQTDMYVNVTTTGNRNLINEYHHIIFPKIDAFIQEDKQLNIMVHSHIKTVRDESLKIFKVISQYKNEDIMNYEDVRTNQMTVGERICFNLANLFAIRKILNLNIPIVLDSPYGKLDDMQRHAVKAFMKGQPCQQILFGSLMEFTKDHKPHYTLN